MANINGGSGNDLILGTFGTDVIKDLLGNNTVYSLFGKKTVILGNGNDIVKTGSCDDVIDAGDGFNIVDSGGGDDSIKTGSGVDIIDAGSGDDIVRSGGGNDLVCAGSGDDKVYGGAGDDIIDAGDGNDKVYGGSGNDAIDGDCGNDWLYGEGEAELKGVTVNFLDTAWTSKISSDGTKIALEGLNLAATGGVFSNFSPWGLSVLSPSDGAPGKGWTNEIDAWNDTPEHVGLTFDTAQTSVQVTLRMAYIEGGYTELLTEKVQFNLVLEDGTTKTVTALATATAQPGELIVNLDASVTGGKAIKSMDISPDTSWPNGVPPQYQNDYNATHPFSEFTIAAVSYTVDSAVTQSSNDVIKGGTGNDKIFGGIGNDKLFGQSGDDWMVGGSGKNLMEGGSGCDSFVFGSDATGVNLILDYSKKYDKLVFENGVSVANTQVIGEDTVLTLSNGGIVILKDTDHGSYAKLAYLKQLYENFSGMF